MEQFDKNCTKKQAMFEKTAVDWHINPESKRPVDHCQPTGGRAGGLLAFCSSVSDGPL